MLRLRQRCEGGGCQGAGRQLRLNLPHCKKHACAEGMQPEEAVWQICPLPTVTDGHENVCGLAQMYVSTEVDKAQRKAQGGNNSQGAIYRIPVRWLPATLPTASGYSICLDIQRLLSKNRALERERTTVSVGCRTAIQGTGSPSNCLWLGYGSN